MIQKLRDVAFDEYFRTWYFLLAQCETTCPESYNRDYEFVQGSLSSCIALLFLFAYHPFEHLSEPAARVATFRLLHSGSTCCTANQSALTSMPVSFMSPTIRQSTPIQPSEHCTHHRLDRIPSTTSNLLGHIATRTAFDCS
jgi:hypothetical protein